MKLRSNLLRLLLPAIVMVLMTGLLLAEMAGISIEARGATIEMLPEIASQPAETASTAARILVACNCNSDQEMAFAKTLTDALTEMHVAYQRVDIYHEPLPDLDAYDTFLYCSQSLIPIEQDAQTLVEWIRGGGHFGQMMTPADDSAFRILYRTFGIMEYDRDYRNYLSLKYVTNLLPFWNDTVYGEGDALTDYALSVRLDPSCTVHMISGGDLAMPLLWEHDVGKGRVAVLNTTLMYNKGGRGFAVSVLFALEDVVVYPIINASMIFIDDFPAPQPTGFNEQLKTQFGYSIQGFFRNLWWPDMKQLAWDLSIRYTGLLIETYNDNVTGPFTSRGVDDSLLKYYAAELLHSGGELGLHGYNHMPLCPEGFDFGGDYNIYWPSTANMAAALEELYRYGKTLYINAEYQTYVAPSNYLSDIGRATLLKTLPNIKVVAGLYLRETGVNALVQEFSEADDGSINVPRITAGFEVDEYMKFVGAQELVLHGVFSHFIHPDDVLDDTRGASQGWTEMFTVFRDVVERITETYPPLRSLTASEGAAAIQRYDRLHVEQQSDDAGIILTLSPFYDEAWLALRTRVAPASITGGELFAINENFYWIRADEAVVRVTWEDGQ